MYTREMYCPLPVSFCWCKTCHMSRELQVSNRYVVCSKQIKVDFNILKWDSLFRCLRNVCNSWELFVEYSTRKSLVCQNDCQRCWKRRKCPDDSSDECTDTSLQTQNVLSSEKQRDCDLEGEFLGIRCLPFESVKACLVSLKIALGKLHRRNLFPYNPKVLIRRYVSLIISPN